MNQIEIQTGLKSFYLHTIHVFCITCAVLVVRLYVPMYRQLFISFFIPGVTFLSKKKYHSILITQLHNTTSINLFKDPINSVIIMSIIIALFSFILIWFLESVWWFSKRASCIVRQLRLLFLCFTDVAWKNRPPEICLWGYCHCCIFVGE